MREGLTVIGNDRFRVRTYSNSFDVFVKRKDLFDNEYWLECYDGDEYDEAINAALTGKLSPVENKQ